MRQAPEPANPSDSPKFVNALAVFVIVLLLGMIAAEGVWYFFGTGFYATLAASFAASFAFGVYLPFVPGEDVPTKIGVVIESFIAAALTMLFFGLIVAAALQFFFGAGFYATLIVSLFLAVSFALLLPFSPEAPESESPSSGVSANAKRSVSDALRGRLAEVGAMSGMEFEEFMADVFRAMGYGVTHMGSSLHGLLRGGIVGELRLSEPGGEPVPLGLRLGNGPRRVGEDGPLAQGGAAVRALRRVLGGRCPLRVIVAGPGPAHGTCRSCGHWRSLRELSETSGGGRRDAPSGICEGCRAG
ncbi:MAG: restriction endonuclease [Actinomycetota bacterium]|nr:restriction endonuclease [Actinomycetota bacterium]